MKTRRRSLAVILSAAVIAIAGFALARTAMRAPTHGGDLSHATTAGPRGSEGHVPAEVPGIVHAPAPSSSRDSTVPALVPSPPKFAQRLSAPPVPKTTQALSNGAGQLPTLAGTSESGQVRYAVNEGWLSVSRLSDNSHWFVADSVWQADVSDNGRTLVFAAGQFGDPPLFYTTISAATPITRPVWPSGTSDLGDFAVSPDGNHIVVDPAETIDRPAGFYVIDLSDVGDATPPPVRSILLGPNFASDIDWTARGIEWNDWRTAEHHVLEVH